MVFNVEITETLSRIVEVECDAACEAEEIARNKWKLGEIVLNADDFAGVEFHSTICGKTDIQGIQ